MNHELGALIAETQRTFRDDASKARATFKSESSLGEGFRSDVEVRGHRLVVDEPESLGGADAGPNPIELILAALGTCQEITYRAYAAALGIPLEHVSVTMEGDIDLRGFFAVDESVRPGYGKLRGTVRVVSPADGETLEKLRQAVDAHCPVLDIVSNPVPVELALEKVGSAGAEAAE